MSPDSLEKVLQAGGNVITDTMSVDSLCRLAVAARDSGATLTIVGSMSVDSMVQVAAAGGGAVTWDVSSRGAK